VLDQPARTAQQTVDDWLYEETDGIVQSGPFAGVWLSRAQAWESGALSPMLLGCHEEELHPALEEQIARLEKLENPKVVNVGCAEGYYAVGLAKRLPKAMVWAIDILEEALEITAECAAANGVNLIIKDNMDNAFAAPDLVVMDCEGHEVSYLDLEVFPALRQATVIVEVHNLRDFPRADEIIIDRFHETHSIENVVEGGRNPNNFGMLQDKVSALRWMCVCENRPCLMNYFVMRPR